MPAELTAVDITVDWATMDTPVGPYTMVVADDVLCAAGFTTDVDRLIDTLPPRTGGRTVRARADLGEISGAVARYFAGSLDAIDAVAVAQVGGPFTSTAWQQLRRIPAGGTVTYTQLAARAGRPDAVRAAGAACAGNRIALVVPCHRVLRADGGLGGYLWGLPVKRWLLEHEKETAHE